MNNPLTAHLRAKGHEAELGQLEALHAKGNAHDGDAEEDAEHGGLQG